jgi:hypothetical protein
MLTRQYRFATRGIELTVQTARQAIDIAGLVAGEVAERLGLHNGHGESDVVNGTVVPESEPPPAPVPSTPPPPAPRTPAARRRAPSAAATPAPGPAVPPAPTPAPASEVRAEPEPPHVSAEPELVETFAEPGAEDGAGAQVRVAEPWPGYRHLKARDVIARLTTATREELAAVELFELAGANRRSVVMAAQRALRRASPPR